MICKWPSGIPIRFWELPSCIPKKWLVCSNLVSEARPTCPILFCFLFHPSFASPLHFPFLSSAIRFFLSASPRKQARLKQNRTHQNIQKCWAAMVLSSPASTQKPQIHGTAVFGCALHVVPRRTSLHSHLTCFCSETFERYWSLHSRLYTTTFAHSIKIWYKHALNNKICCAAHCF